MLSILAKWVNISDKLFSLKKTSKHHFYLPAAKTNHWKNVNGKESSTQCKVNKIKSEKSNSLNIQLKHQQNNRKLLIIQT